MGYEVLIGNCLETMEQIDDESIDTCITSPPYWGLRDYQTATWEGGDENCDHKPPEEKGEWISSVAEYKSASHASRYNKTTCHKCGAKRIDSQIGMEETPEEYIQKLVDVFSVVRRKLKPTGTLWLNLGDTYFGGGGDASIEGLKPKDLVGIPWRVALALQADGWWLRQDIIWSKPSCMPEAVKDRCTKSHEYIFLLTKNKQYFYDHEAIKEPIKEASFGRMQRSIGSEHKRTEGAPGQTPHSINKERPTDRKRFIDPKRNKRSVWTVAPKPYSGAHFAVYPPELVEPCILAGTSAYGCCSDCGSPWKRISERLPTGYDGSKYGESAVKSTGGAISGGTKKSTLGSSGGKLTATYQTLGWQPTCECHSDLPLDEHPIKRGVVLDPFGGSGTTAGVAIKNNRDAILCELNEEYAALMDDRINMVTGGFRQGQKTLTDY